eukprot:6096692-Amphidinium_carterae.1
MDRAQSRSALQMGKLSKTNPCESCPSEAERTRASRNGKKQDLEEPQVFSHAASYSTHRFICTDYAPDQAILSAHMAQCANCRGRSMTVLCPPSTR